MTTSADPWFPIRTERLVLRDFRRRDFDDVLAYGSDPEVARYMDWGPNTPDQTREFLARAFDQQSLWPRFDFGLAIEHASAERVIGSIGQGLASEAAGALVDAGFRRLALHRIFATCDVRNTASFGLMERLRMRREGCFAQDRQIKGEWRDTYLYAALAGDWVGAS
jgi:RimJ/RimL family protein N-acetyltransferase